MKKQYREFMLSSNKIEGEDRINPGDDLAIRTILLSELSEDLVLLVHDILGKYLKVDWTGKYRMCDVRVGNYVAPSYLDVPELMKAYFKELPNMDSFEAHNVFESIHCFQDLNGRMGRLIWLKKAIEEECYFFEIPFLHKYYYQSLAHQQGQQREVEKEK